MMRCLRCLLFTIFFIFLTSIDTSTASNQRPIVGVIAQEMRNGNYNNSFIAASYVKALEASGARVVPIYINETESYYRRVLGYVNGVVIPGGSALFNVTGGFASAVTYVFKIAKEMTVRGPSAFPILGVCQGMEILSYIGSHMKNPLVPCHADNINLPLDFNWNFRNSRLYRELPYPYERIFKMKNVTNNHHEFCLTEENFKKFGMDNDWNILSTNYDKNGLKFISGIESKRFAFAGVQFHPEKPAYEWNPTQDNPHDFRSILVNRYFYDWLVNTAKQNDNRFPDKTTTNNWLIYNHPITYTPNGYDMEMYYFRKNAKKATRQTPQIVAV